MTKITKRDEVDIARERFAPEWHTIDVEQSTLDMEKAYWDIQQDALDAEQAALDNRRKEGG